MSKDTNGLNQQLASFFPYRLAVLSEAVSRSMAQIYAVRFDLSRDEWRVLAALYKAPPTKTTAIIEHTTLDKLSASRALARMEGKGLVSRSVDPDDARAYLVKLLPAGRELYKKIEPLVLARERFLLEDLGADELASLNALHDKLLLRARQLVEMGDEGRRA
ncbi:MAG: MarR family transcriptional regulator [Curvibacter sp.]|nr:MarR family transcriptional regulator [Curvibacter sp.]